MHYLEKLIKEDEVFAKAVKHDFKVFHAKDIVIHEGDVHHTIFVIDSGKVRVKKTAHLGNEKPLHPGLADLGPGQIFGEFCIVDEIPACADVVALEPTTILEVDRDSLLTYLDQHPDIGYFILREMLSSLVTHLRRSNEAVAKLLVWGIKKHDIDKFM